MPPLSALRAFASEPVPLIAASIYLGAVFGGFATVLHERLPTTEGGVTAGLRAVAVEPSACPACGRALAWTEKAPLVGYLLCRGRCRGCKVPIPARYPLIEAFTLIGVFGTTLEGLGTAHAWGRLGFACLAAVICALADAAPEAALTFAVPLGAAGLLQDGVALAPHEAALLGVGTALAVVFFHRKNRQLLGLLALCLVALPWYGGLATAAGVIVTAAVTGARREPPSPFAFAAGTLAVSFLCFALT